MNKKRLIENNAIIVNALDYFVKLVKSKQESFFQLSYKDNKLDFINGHICLRLDLSNYNQGLIIDNIVKPMLLKAGITLELKDGFNFRKNRNGYKETNTQDNFSYDMFDKALNLIDKTYLVEFLPMDLILIQGESIKKTSYLRLLKPKIETDINKGKYLFIKQEFLENACCFTMFSIEKSSNDKGYENCYTRPLIIQDNNETIKVIISPYLHSGKIL